MKVYVGDDGVRRLVGRADVPVGCGPVLEVPMFGAAAPSIVETFAIGTVTHLSERRGAPVVERAVPASPGQLVHLLSGWVPLSS